MLLPPLYFSLALRLTIANVGVREHLFLRAGRHEDVVVLELLEAAHSVHVDGVLVWVLHDVLVASLQLVLTERPHPTVYPDLTLVVG